MERYAPSAKDLASRDVVSRAMTIEIREGPRRRAEQGPHLPAPRPSRSEGAARAAAGHLRNRRASSPASTSPASRSRCCRRSTTTWAASRRTITARSLTKVDGDPDTVVPGLMAVGEAACVSVHGANRLGSNSLIDLVVFGRAAAKRCRDTIMPTDKHRDLPKDAGDRRFDRLDHFRHANGGVPTAELRNRMQRIMQDNCAVFRTGEVLAEGHERIHAVWAATSRYPGHRPFADLEHRPDRDARVRQSDRSGGDDDGFGGQPHGKPRRACPRGLSRPRRPELDEAYARLYRCGASRSASTTGRCIPTR